MADGKNLFYKVFGIIFLALIVGYGIYQNIQHKKEMKKILCEARAEGKAEGIAKTLKEIDKAIETQEKNIKVLETTVQSMGLTDEVGEKFEEYIKQVRKDLEEAKKRRDGKKTDRYTP